MTTKTNPTALTDEQIAAYEARGFKRWTKGNLDRLYINAKDYGVEFEYYKTGNISDCYFRGERVSNSEGRRFKATKVFIDVKTGELSVTTATDYEAEIREAVEAIIAEVEAELNPEPEATEDEQAAADYLRHLTTGGTFDPDMEDGHFAVDGREYEIAESGAVRRVDDARSDGATRRELRVVFTEGAPDALGNAGNVETSIEFVGPKSFVTMTFGGRDGMQRDSVTLAELRDIFARIGVDC